MLDKTDFETKNITRDKKSFYNEKMSIYQESIIILNFYAHNNRISKYIAKRNRQICIFSCRFQYLSLNI